MLFQSQACDKKPVAEGTARGVSRTRPGGPPCLREFRNNYRAAALAAGPLNLVRELIEP